VFSNSTCNIWPGCELTKDTGCYNASCPDIFEYGTCVAKGCYWFFGLCMYPSSNDVIILKGENLLINILLLLFTMVYLTSHRYN